MSRWTSTTFARPGRLQNADKVVQSIRECRAAYSNLTDREFARWYEQHYKVPERRTLAILAAIKVEGNDIA